MHNKESVLLLIGIWIKNPGFVHENHSYNGWSWRWIFRSLCNDILPECNHYDTWRSVNSNDVLVGRPLVVFTLIILVSCARKKRDAVRWIRPNIDLSDLVSFDITEVHKITQIARFMGAYMGPTWSRQDPGGPHAGTIILGIWEKFDQQLYTKTCRH